MYISWQIFNEIVENLDLYCKKYAFAFYTSALFGPRCFEDVKKLSPFPIKQLGCGCHYILKARVTLYTPGLTHSCDGVIKSSRSVSCNTPLKAIFVSFFVKINFSNLKYTLEFC